MTRLITIILLILLGYFTVKSMFRAPKRPARSAAIPEKNSREDASVMLRDPQCGTYVEKEDAVKAVIADQIVYFCSEECRDKYLAREGRES